MFNAILCVFKLNYCDFKISGVFISSDCLQFSCPMHLPQLTRDLISAFVLGFLVASFKYDSNNLTKGVET